MAAASVLVQWDRTYSLLVPVDGAAAADDLPVRAPSAAVKRALQVRLRG